MDRRTERRMEGQKEMGGWTLDGWTGGRRTDGQVDRGRMDGLTDGQIDGWMDGRMDGRTDGWTDRWMDGKRQVLLSFLARLKEFLDCKNILPILRFFSCQDVVRN